MLSQDQRRKVWILIAAVFLFSAVLSEVIRPGQAQYMIAARATTQGDLHEAEAAKSFLKGSSFQALLPTLFGVREVVASLMWVQADDYFHRGEYRPIIRMVKQITMIDPHQLDVYATGAWHMAYNFLDKRLIVDGVKFLEEGCRNNDSVYDLFFELGYMHYDKTKLYPRAVEAYKGASLRGTTTGKKLPPSYVRHQLAHAMEKMGDIDQSVKQWRENLAVAEEQDRQGGNPSGPAGSNTAAALHNLYITERRRNERLAAVAERAGDRREALQQWQLNVELADAWLKRFPGHRAVTDDRLRAINQVARLSGSGKLFALAQTDLTPRFTVTRLAPRRILVEGTCNALDLSRVHIRLQDKDYENRSQDFDFKMENCTLEYENSSVRRGKFRFEFKLDKDPADMERDPAEIYPLKAEEYELSVSYNPRLQATFIQDVYGWNGEGLTARPEFLKTDPARAGIVNGKSYPLRYVERKITLKREDLIGSGKKVLAKAL